MPLYTRIIKFPITLTAPDAKAADTFARDQVEAVIEGLEARDTAQTIAVGRVSVTRPGDQPEPARTPAPARAEQLTAYGCGPLARNRVARWLAEGRAVDSRLVRGGWVHRPVGPAPDGKPAAAARVLAAAENPNTVLWAVDPKAGAA